MLAARDVLGVSLETIYRRRQGNSEIPDTLVDCSDSRRRALRRVKNRTGLTAFNIITEYNCSCSSPCLSEADPSSLEALYHKFAAISERPRSYENENEFIIDLLYDAFSNTDISYCEKSIAEILGVCSRRIMRARKVVLLLISDPSLLLQDKIAPPHGMLKYSSQHHPMNRTAVAILKAIAQGLDMALRADPAASDGRVTFRFYDRMVNTFDKVEKMLHNSMRESLGESVEALSSTTFRRIFAEHLDERDDRLSSATADHNCCPHCQELELRISALEMELMSMENESVADFARIAH